MRNRTPNRPPRKPQSSSRPAPRLRSEAGSARLMPLKAWLSNHAYALLSSLGQLIRTPLPTLMTAAVIGIALALPSGLFVLLDNAHEISRDWDGSLQLSLFLKLEQSDADAQRLANLLEQRADIAEVRVISREQALNEYRQLSSFNDALQALDSNPLPAVLVVQPSVNDSDVVQQLVKELENQPEVDIAQFDMRWLKRLFAMLEIVRRGVLILGLLLSFAVLLIVGNTIRLSIYNRREEIEVTKLFGGTDAFIRRPFLYNGIWFGFAGGLIAWLLVQSAFWALARPVQHLTMLYHSDYQLVNLGFDASLNLLGIGMLLGLIGAWLAVGWHLRSIQPR